MSSRPVVYLLDAHYQIFRAYHSVPDLRAPDGSPVGALRGYAATLIKFLRERSPTHVAVAFDHALTSFRNELYPAYKAGRTEAPEDLEPQFALCAEVTRALGIPLFELEDFEADDVIATLTRQLVEDGADVMIVTCDKDLGALVSNRVWLLDLATGERSGPEEIEARMGVPPELVADYLALVGDATDNIPGVRGIGARTASILLRQLGSIESVPRDPVLWEELGIRGAKRIAQCLEEGRDRLELSRELVRLQANLPIEAKISDVRYEGAHRAQLEGLFGRLGINVMLERVPRWCD
jgi:DNA polymerase-1